MKKHFLIYGILLFLLFEKFCEILIVVFKILDATLHFDFYVGIVMITLSVLIPAILFFIILKKLTFDKTTLVVLLGTYVITFFLFYLLNHQIGNVTTTNTEVTVANNMIETKVFAWATICVVLSKIIVITVLSINSFKLIAERKV